MTATPQRCSQCQTALTGPFCSQCGAVAAGLTCTQCQTQLVAGVRYCHRCGSSVKAGGSSPRERRAWVAAAIACVLALAAIGYEVLKAKPQAVIPSMANAGNAEGAGAPEGRPPDISRMSPDERFERLYDRVMRALSAQDSAQVIQFAPMAIAAYEQLGQANPDQRYHAAMLHLAVGQTPAAGALADSILAEVPNHLFGIVIKGVIAEQSNDAAALSKAYTDFLSQYDAEMKAARPEYLDHKPVLDDFLTRAKANRK
ncbi:MAG: zinc ribbon domain-containing protein [Gemmatimonadota bacterium]